MVGRTFSRVTKRRRTNKQNENMAKTQSDLRRYILRWNTYVINACAMLMNKFLITLVFVQYRILHSCVLQTRENTSPHLCNTLPYCTETSVKIYISHVGLRGILWASIRGICRNQAYTHTICKCWTHSGLSYRYLFISMSQTCLYNIS